MDRLDAMRAFVHVVDTGSFSAAAHQLRMGQPAVSKAIAQLEDRLGIRLLLRSSRALTITEAGGDFYERAKRIVEDAHEAELAARGSSARLSGRIRFSAPVTLARLHIIPRLPAFLSRHPELTIQAVLDDRRINPVEEAIDVAIRLGNQPNSTLTARRIGRCKRLVVGTPAYFRRAGVPATPDDLKDHRTVVYAGTATGTSWSFRKAGVAKTVTLRGDILMTAAEGTRESVLAGLGVAVASEWMFRPELQTGAVVSILHDWTLPHADLWAVFPTGKSASVKARAFADFVESAIRDKRPIGREV
jgi:DNA-binding transcriptional LysR family regulator